MKQSKKKYRIEVVFVVEGGKNFIEEFTQKTGISPNHIRTKEDWPDVIKNNLNLPEELKPRYEWNLNEIAIDCKQIEIPINKIISKLHGKEEVIAELCNKYNLQSGLVITIHGKQMALPEIVLSSKIVSYFGKLETEISFDIYVY